MAESSPHHSLFQTNLIQLKKKLITAHGNSIVIRKGVNAKKIREKQIFSKSKIHFLISIGEKNEEKAFVLALSSKRIALFQLKKESPIAIFKLDEKIVDHGTVQVFDMGRRKEEEFRVKLNIPIAFHSGTVRKMRLTVHFDDTQITKQKMKCLEEMRMENENMRFCADLGNDNFFGFFEGTIVKSDGLVTRAEEPSTKKKRRIAVVGKELWHGNILLATENGTIRVVRVKDGIENESNSMRIFSEGQCIPPHCTLRCREPSVIISTENTVIVGTQRGEIYCFIEQFKLRCKIDTEGGPINCLKVDENDKEFLWVGFESGELRRIKLKKARSDQVFGGGCKRSETPMECLESGCNFKSLVASSFLDHLMRIHRTSPALAGLVLRCDCGNESISSNHSRKCSISNFTVIRKHSGPIRTFADVKITPKCVFCEVYPKTLYAYSTHVYEAHQSTLAEIGCHVNCGVCDGHFYTVYQCREHTKKCKSRFFSLLKLGEEKKRNDEEIDQTTDA